MSRAMVRPLGPLGPMMLTGLVTRSAEGPKVSSPSMLRSMVAGPLAVNAGAKVMVSAVFNGWVRLICWSCCADRPVVLPESTTWSALRRVKTFVSVALSSRLVTVSTAGTARSSNTSSPSRTRLRPASGQRRGDRNDDPETEAMTKT